MDDTPNNPPLDREEMARLLKATIRKRRSPYLRTLTISLILILGVLILFAWLFWPRPALPRLNLLAFDQVARPGETVQMEGWLTPQDARLVAPDLSELDVSFEPLAARARPGAAAQEIKARSTTSGRVVASVPARDGEETIEFTVSHVASRPRYRTEDRARLFVWKPQTRVLVVEVAALAEAGPEAWQGNRIANIAVRKSAGEALKAARTKDYQIIYLATGASTPMAYRLMRAWVESKSQEGGLFPEGPVLGQLPPNGPPAARDWAERFAAKRRWHGPLAAVAKDPQLAEALRDAGATSFILTEAAEVPADTKRLLTWADLKL